MKFTTEEVLPEKGKAPTRISRVVDLYRGKGFFAGERRFKLKLPWMRLKCVPHEACPSTFVR